MHKIVTLIVLFSILLSSGCSSIINGTTQPLSVEASPNTATIKLLTSKGVLIKEQPGTLYYDLKRGDGFFSGADYNLEVALNGYTTQVLPLRSSLSGWYIGNILFGGIPGVLVVDPLTGGMWKISTKDGRDIDNLRVQLLQNTSPSEMKVATKIK